MSVLSKLMERIETKNSWDKNELKMLILDLLIEDVEAPDHETPITGK